MPLYEYECDACGQRFEAIRKFSESDLDVCSLCGKGPVRRLMSSPAIQFKGTGWYVTDYAQKGKTGDSSSGSSSSSEKKSETAKPDSATTSSDTKSSTTASTTSKD